MVRDFVMRVSKVKEWCEGIKSIYLEYVGADRMEYNAGQYVLLSGVVGGKKISRAYSLASQPSSKNIEIIFRVVGVFTGYLNTLKEGDTITMTGPFGHISLSNVRSSKVVFIATGTGVSPFISIIRDMHEKGMCGKFEKIVLIYGTRYRNMIVHFDDFVEHSKECKNFNFVPVLSKEENWNGKKGHVQDVLNEFIYEDAEYFICGLPLMTEDVVKILGQKGISMNKIHLERF
ncbi:MAG: ferredoxin--NADP reductase [Candidatus Micrarchaeia archaeon]